ncbi:Conserved_hypothetical protein [Hexamita inflata]|uniref:DUF1349 domain-containing protein n=1 Tax=Hexamita inflata TaxID=28002 RepID=A0ABP1GFG1_9EUKA
MQNYSFINEPKSHAVTSTSVTIKTEPKTDYFNKTYFNMEMSNAPAYVMSVKNDFTYTVRTHQRFSAPYDQAQLFMFVDNNNWVKAGLEGGPEFQQIGAVVTQFGYSDWSTFDYDPKCDSVTIRAHRKGNDFKIEFKTEQMKEWIALRIFHMHNATEEIKIGVMACSPFAGSFEAKFDQFKLEELQWK